MDVNDSKIISVNFYLFIKKTPLVCCVPYRAINLYISTKENGLVYQRDMSSVPLLTFCAFFPPPLSLSSSLPKPILKKAVAPRPSSSRSTDEDIQGSKDALIQDLEKKLRSKEARRRSSQVFKFSKQSLIPANTCTHSHVLTPTVCGQETQFTETFK